MSVVEQILLGDFLFFQQNLPNCFKVLMRPKARDGFMEQFAVVMPTVFNHEIKYIPKESGIRIFVAVGVLLFDFFVLGGIEIEVIFIHIDPA